MINFFLEIFSCLSRLLNVLTGGSADMTFSARSHVDQLWSEQIIDWVALRLFKEEDHCRVWWEAEVLRSFANIALAREQQTPADSN